MNAAANDEFFNFSNSNVNSKPDSLSYNDRLADKISLLAGQINAANYRFLKLVAEFDRLEAWAGYGFRSCAHWLDWKCGIALGAAREKVRVARALEGLPDINAAFEVGELSYSKVRAMTRVATDKNEEFLLMIAQFGTAQNVEKLVGVFRTVSQYEDFQPDDKLRERLEEEFKSEQSEQIKQAQERQFSCYQDDDNMWVIRARLPAEEGGLFVKLIAALGDQIAVNHKDRKCVPAGTSECDIADMVDNSAADIEPLTFVQCRADALVAIAEQFLAQENSGDAFKDSQLKGSQFKGSERCQLMLHVHAGSDAIPSSAHLDGRWLGHNAAMCLACDASLVVVEEDEVGNVLNIGRRSRVIPAAMSRALVVRDQGHCQFPGCCESRFVEGHHIKHWAEGGETRLDNLVTLCRYHHRELHRGHFFLSVKPATENSDTEGAAALRFSERLSFSRGGLHVNGQPFKEGEVVIEGHPACAVHASNELPWSICRGIGVETAVTRWQGERMDLSMAVEGLLHKSGLRV